MAISKKYVDISTYLQMYKEVHSEKKFNPANYHLELFPPKSKLKRQSWMFSNEDFSTMIFSLFDASHELRIEDCLDLDHLENVRDLFETHQPSLKLNSNTKTKSKVKIRKPGHVNFEEFCQIMAHVLGTTHFKDQLQVLFDKLNTSSDGYVNWNEFCSYMLLHFRETDFKGKRKEKLFENDPRIRHSVFNRQEPTARLMLLNNPLRVLTVSKGGEILMWNSHLTLDGHGSIRVDENQSITNSCAPRKRFHEWIMDAVYMPNAHKLVLATSAREMRFFDVATTVFVEEVQLYALPNIPICFEYYYESDKTFGKSYLFVGDECGNVLFFTFLNASISIFDIPQNSGHVQRVWMENINEHTSCVKYILIKSLHSEPVNMIRYQSEKHTFMSCSSSSQASVVTYDISRQRVVYTFNLRRGCQCFDINRNLNVLATGSSDHIARLWNPFVTTKPQAVLTGHNEMVIAVNIHEITGMLITYSSDAIIKVWDLKEYSCCQTVIVRLPFMIKDKLPEHMNFPMLLNLASNTIYLTSAEYILVYELGGTTTNVPIISTPQTHQSQLCAALYNPYFKQVLSGSDDSCLITWNVENGAKCLSYNNAHGEEEITAIAFDNDWKHMFSGARNGTVKVWNFQNGQNVQKYEPSGGVAEVTAILPVLEQQIVLTTGWNRLIARYKNNNHENHWIRAEIWNTSVKHKDDILASDYCPPHYLATGSFDGEIIVWHAETEKVLARLQHGVQTSLYRKLSILQGIDLPASKPATPSSRPNSRHRSSYRLPKGIPAPVDKLLFLRWRVQSKALRESALLISSESGTLRFWTIISPATEVASFYAAYQLDESILGVATDKHNTILITGDTCGYVAIWKINEYALKIQDSRMLGRAPRRLQCFKAHDAAIVSVDYVQHDCGNFVLTASVDCTARLFAASDGALVGIFGQSKPWSLKKRTTWAQARIDLHTEEVRFKEELLAEDHETIDSPHLVAKTPMKELLQHRDDDMSELTASYDYIDDSYENKDAESTPSPFNISPMIRSHTYAGQLGKRAEADFQRIRESRQERRQHNQEVTPKALCNGKQCTPFTALEIENLDLNIPSSLFSSKLIEQPVNNGSTENVKLASSGGFLKNSSKSRTTLGFSRNKTTESVSTKLPPIFNNSDF